MARYITPQSLENAQHSFLPCGLNLPTEVFVYRHTFADRPRSQIANHYRAAFSVSGEFRKSLPEHSTNDPDHHSAVGVFLSLNWCCDDRSRQDHDLRTEGRRHLLTDDPCDPTCRDVED